MYKDMMDTIGMVNAADPELGAAMELHPVPGRLR